MNVYSASHDQTHLMPPEASLGRREAGVGHLRGIQASQETWADTDVHEHTQVGI